MAASHPFDQVVALYNNVYDASDPNRPDFEEYLFEAGYYPDGTLVPDAPGDDTTPVAPIQDTPAPAPTAYDPATVQAAYNDWLAAGAHWPPPDWIILSGFVRQVDAYAASQAAAQQRQQGEIDAALAILAQQPPQVRANYDLGGTGYGSAQTIVMLANPGADGNAVINQAIALQTAADAAGVLPAEVVSQVPGAAQVGTTIDPTTIVNPGNGSAANPTGTGNNVPLGPDGAAVSGSKSKIGLVFAALLGGWLIFAKKKAA